jgi:hypothetical protein
VALLWTPMPAAFGSTMETPIAFLAHPVRARFQAEVPWDIREVVRGQVPSAGPVKVVRFQAEALWDMPEVVVEQGQVPAGGPAKVADLQVAFLEQVAEAAERGRVLAVGHIFGGLLRVEAVKVTARKEDVGQAPQQGCVADALPAQARWPSRPD